MTDAPDKPAFLDACEPPWIVFPFIKPAELPSHMNQGVAEPWFMKEWIPFWSSLSEAQQQQYLDHWNTSREWRDMIEYVFKTIYEEYDPEDDARAVQRWAEERRLHAERRPLWLRLWRRVRGSLD